MLVHNFLKNSVKKYPDKTAVIIGGDRFDYTRINQSSTCLANGLIAEGIKKGDRVAILLENSLEYIVSYYAVLKAGGVAVPLGTDVKPKKLQSLLVKISPGIIISSSRYERVLKSTDLSLPGLKALVMCRTKNVFESGNVRCLLFADILACQKDYLSDVFIDENDLASIIFTSGSTGVPKGVMLSHKNIVSNTASICEYQVLSHKDIHMVVLPFFYVMGKSLLNTHFAVGGTVVINNNFAYPADVVHEMIREGVTGISGVPSTYATLLYRSPLGKHRNFLTSLRFCAQAGGHMADAVKKELRDVLPEQTDIFVMYGATEASARLSYLPPENFTAKMGSIGKAIPGVTLKILDNNGREAQDGEIGEIVAAGSNIMKGYWQDPDGTKRVLTKDGYHTGDLGYRDKDGMFFVSCRNDSLLKVDGHRINPKEIEDVIMASGRVVECVIVGIPDDKRGNILLVLVVPRLPVIDHEEILRFCSRYIPRFMLPEKIINVRGLPKRANGKIDMMKCSKLADGKK